jgi:hypothetical protein
MLLPVIVLGVIAGMVVTFSTKQFWHLDRTITPDPQPFTVTAESLHADQDFVFVVAETDNMEDGWCLRLDHQGRCHYGFADRPRRWDSSALPVWKSVTFAVDSATVAELQDLLIQTRFFSLGKDYSRRVEGCYCCGSWRADYVGAQTGGNKKVVRCFRWLPRDVQRLSEFTETRLLPGQTILQAATVDPEVTQQMRAFLLGE